MKVLALSILAVSSLLLTPLAAADLTQPETPDFRGFENATFVRWNDWNNTTYFNGNLSGADPDSSTDPQAWGFVANPAGFMTMSTPGVICSDSPWAEVGYGYSGQRDVEEVVIQIGGPDAALIDAYLLYPDFPDPEALGYVEARDLPGGGKLFRFLASPHGQGIGTYSEFTGFVIRLSVPNSVGTLCLDEIQLDVRHSLTGSFASVCNGATVNSLLFVKAGIDLGGSSVASDNVFELTASGIPQSSFGLFLVSRGVGSVTCTGSCVGSLCLDPNDVGRIGPALNAGPDYSFERTLDLTNVPTNPSMPAMAGQSYYFQAWYRDSAGGVPVSRFTDAAAVTFR